MAHSVFSRMARVVRRGRLQGTDPLRQDFLVEALEPRILMSADLSLLTSTSLVSQQKHSLPTAAPALVQVDAVTPVNAFVVTPAVTPAPAPAEAWIGGTSGAWDNADNWSGGVVPDATTDVTIAGKNTVALGTDAVHALTLSGGVTLQGGALTVNAASTLDGSSLSGTSLTLGAGLTLNGTNTLASTTLTATGSTIANTGTLSLTGSASQTLGGSLDNSGAIKLQGSGSLVLATAGSTTTDINEASGVIDLESTGGIQSSVGQGLTLTLANSGTLEKTDTSGIAAVSLPLFTNQGKVDVAAGTLGFAGGEMTGSTAATVTVETGASLDLTGGHTETYGGMLDATGAGTVALAGGTVQVDAAGFTINAAPGMLDWTGGLIDATNNAQFNVASYVFTNAGSMTLDGTAGQAIIGTFNNAGIFQNATGTLNLSYTTFFGSAYSGVLNNSGTYKLFDNTQIENGSINNIGTIERATGTGTSTIASNFTNTNGTLDVESGTLDIGSFNTTLAGGTFRIATGGEVLFPTTQEFGSSTLSGTLVGTGAGTVVFDDVAAGIATAGATFNFASGELQWIGGKIGGSGVLTNAGDITFLPDSANIVPDIQTALVNTGTIELGGNLVVDGHLTNAVGGVITFKGDTLSGGGTFTNDGLVDIASGALSTIDPHSATLDADGTVEVETGTLDVTNGAWFGQAIEVSSGATLVLAGGSYSGTFTDKGTKPGTLQFSGGTIAAAGATFDFDPGVFQWTGGTIDATAGTLTNTGTITLPGTGTKSLGGVLTNLGTIVDANATLALTERTSSATISGTLNDNGLYSVSGNLDLTAGTFDMSGGTLDLQSGTLTVSGGTLANATIEAAAGAIFDITGSYTFSGLFTGMGPGLVELNGGLYTAAAAGGTLDFSPGALMFLQGEFVGGTSGFTNKGTLTLNQQGQKSQFSGVFTNAGTFEVVGVSAFELLGDASFTNNAGAVVDFQGDGSLLVGSSTRQTFLNLGDVEKTAGSLTTISAGGFNTTGGTVVADAGTISFTNGSTGGPSMSRPVRA